MDWDLWGPSYPQESPENSLGIQQHEWECDFYFGYGADVIEEDALNEKSCVEALRKLISKANIEIEELEEDLAVLQTQLEWAEQNKLKEWFEVCCKGLEEKTNFLELLIQNLKNENVQNECDHDFQSLMHGDPPRRISEMVKDLIRTCCQRKSDQFEDMVVKDASRDGIGESSDRESLSNFDSGSSITDDSLEPSVTHAGIGLDLAVIVKDFRSDAFSNRNGKFYDKKSLSSSGLKNITKEEVKESNVCSINISLNASMKHDEKSDHPVTITAQEVGVFGTDNAIAESPSDMQANVAAGISVSDTMVVQEPRNCATNSIIDENLHLKFQQKITKDEMQFLPVDGHEPFIPPIADVISNSSSNSRVRDWKKPGSVFMNDKANNQKTTKLAQLISSGVQEPANDTNDTNDKEISLLPPSKPVVKRRKVTKPSASVKVEESSGTPAELVMLQGVTVENSCKEDLQLFGQEPGVVDDNSHDDLVSLLKLQATQNTSTKSANVAQVNENNESVRGNKLKSSRKTDLQFAKSCVASEPSTYCSSHDSFCPPSKPKAKRPKGTTQIHRDPNEPCVALEKLTLQGDVNGVKSGEGLEFCKSSTNRELHVASDNKHGDVFQQSKSCEYKRKQSRDGKQSHDEVTSKLPTDRDGMMKLRLTALKAIAKERGLKGFSSKKKEDVVTLLLQEKEDIGTPLPQGQVD